MTKYIKEILIIVFTVLSLLNVSAQSNVSTANGGIPPYTYSKDGGQTFQNNPIFKNLPYGSYNLAIKDSLNCLYAYTKSITAQSQQAIANFIVNTTMMAKDTFVVVDISNPRPDTVIWSFPPSIRIVDNNPFAPVIISNDTGEVTIAMKAHFGDCVLEFSKKVRCIKPDTLKNSTNGNGIELINVYPNPNNGEFSVEIKLFKKQAIAMYVYNSLGAEQIRIIIPETDYTLNKITLPVKTPGTYLLKVIAEYDSKTKTIIVTQ